MEKQNLKSDLEGRIEVDIPKNGEGITANSEPDYYAMHIFRAFHENEHPREVIAKADLDYVDLVGGCAFLGRQILGMVAEYLTSRLEHFAPEYSLKSIHALGSRKWNLAYEIEEHSEPAGTGPKGFYVTFQRKQA